MRYALFFDVEFRVIVGFYRTSQVHRLCVCASGSLITDIFICRTFIRVSCLHFGQNKGNFSSTVSSRNFNLVLFPHTGHNSHFSCFMLTPPAVLLLEPRADAPASHYKSGQQKILLFSWASITVTQSLSSNTDNCFLISVFINFYHPS